MTHKCPYCDDTGITHARYWWHGYDIWCKCAAGKRAKAEWDARNKQTAGAGK